MTAKPLTPEQLDRAARAIQRVYLNYGHPADFTEQEIAEDFVRYREMYEGMALASLRA